VIFEAHEDPDVDSVWLWFQFQNKLIAEERRRVLDTFRPLGDIGAKRAPEPQFVGLAPEEVGDIFDAQRDRLELLAMFDLLATSEAFLRRDFESRTAARKRDSLSRRYRELRKESGHKIRLDEEILAALREEVLIAKALLASIPPL